ncbi:hypothetical protein HDU86_004151 [Geranomyces michiganensis]|nr:hypothetical protein HDU86_004151 [Geranomyces michiganensis]
MPGLAYALLEMDIKVCIPDMSISRMLVEHSQSVVQHFFLHQTQTRDTRWGQVDKMQPSTHGAIQCERSQH